MVAIDTRDLEEARCWVRSTSQRAVSVTGKPANTRIRNTCDPDGRFECFEDDVGDLDRYPTRDCVNGRHLEQAVLPQSLRSSRGCFAHRKLNSITDPPMPPEPDALDLRSARIVGEKALNLTAELDTERVGLLPPRLPTPGPELRWCSRCRDGVSRKYLPSSR